MYMGQKALSIWESVIKRIPSQDLVAMRVGLGLPVNGLATEENHRAWVNVADKEFKNKKDDGGGIASTRFYKLLSYQRKIATTYKEIEYGFEFAINDLILKGFTDRKTLYDSEDSGCKFFVAENKEGLSNGVYLRIGPTAVVADIKKFVNGKSGVLKKYQKQIYGSESTRYKSPDDEHFYRDLLIYEYGKHSLKEIKEIFKKYPSDVDLTGSPTKEILIQRLLRNLGFKVDSDNIKQILARRRRRLKSDN